MQIYYITRCICVCSACVSLNSFLIPGCTNIRRKVYKCQKIKKASETRSDTLRDFLLWNIIQRKNLISEMLRASLPLCPRVKLHSRCCTESNGHAMRATREFFYLLRFDSGFQLMRNPPLVFCNEIRQKTRVRRLRCAMHN